MHWHSVKIIRHKVLHRIGGQTVLLEVEGSSYEVFPVLASPADAEPVASCEEHGVLGPIVGTVGSLAALEAIKV